MNAHHRWLHREERKRYNLVHPTLGTITKARADELWANRGQLSWLKLDEELAVTPEEDQIVRFLWEQMPGTSCWMSAFFIYLNQES